ncbi:O-antigen ligase family protein [Limnoglobus roseus]|uniref:O-antigen ligase n=1 Tax=Limnoglobus roseus TaxID=2598579 RepID=A0A5C1A887_9BACT|nr:O-antigen ligase family protein [Limnoglobus roseus]QEL15539.1 O-antigen ligase [Limnoglobus roseus]
MKQLIYMGLMLLLGSVGAVVYGSFWSIFVYYNFTVLRPPYLWRWSLPPGIEWQTYAAAPAILFAIVSFGETSRPGRGWSTIHLFLVAFFAWLTVSLFFAQYEQVAYQWYVVNFKIFLMAFVGSVLIATVQHVRWLFWMVGAGLGYIGYEMNFQYFVNHFMIIRTHGFAEYDNNTAGLMLAMGLPLCWFAWEGITNRWRWVFALFIPFLLHAVLMSFSRGAMLSLVVVTPLIVLRSRYRIWTAVFVLGFALVGLPFFAGQEIRDRFLSIEKQDADASAASRFSTWGAAYRMAKDHPIFGVGLRNSPFLVGRYGNANAHQTIHSQYLQVAADTGFVGLGLYLGLMGAALVATNRARRGCGALPPEVAISTKAVVNGLECSLVTFLIGAVFLSLETFEVTYILLILIARLSIIVRACQIPP